MQFLKVIVCLAAFIAGPAAQAATIATTNTYAGNNTSVGNCIPFGCPDAYGPNMGFIYQGIGAFTLNVGDIVAFDTGRANDTALSFDLSIGQLRNGGSNRVDRDGMSFLGSLTPLTYGDSIVGNYDIAFVVQQAYSYAGTGNLILNLENTNGAVFDVSYNQNLVYSNDNSFGFRRYYSGAFPGDTRDGDTAAIANLRIINFANVSEVPLPASLPLLLAALGGFAILKRRKG